MTPALAAFLAFIPPRAPGDRRDSFSVVIVNDAPHYISQSEDSVTTGLRGALARSAIELANQGAQTP